MRGSLRIQGMDRVRISLRNIAEKVPDGARKVMHRAADDIVKTAKIMTPVDLGNLENSIKILKSYGYRGRLQIDIGVEPSGGEVNYNGKPINVNDYAAIIHENYEQYKPGKRTLAKRAQYPGYYIGSGFMTRAAAREEPLLNKQMIDTIERIILEEDVK
jgi:hypothetical protein